MDLTKAIEIIRKVAYEAGQTAANMQKNAVIADQRRQDFVTDADLKLAKLIQERLKTELFEGIPFFTEETKGEMLLEGKLFVVDEIDGTVNFFRQDPFWGPSIALVEDTHPIAGAICMPGINGTFSATSTGDAIVTDYTSAHERTLHVTTEKNLLESRVWYDIDVGKLGDELSARRFLAINNNTTQPTSRGAAVAGPIALALGMCDAHYHSGPKPYDMAAGGLIVQRAGGTVTDIDGNSWHAFSKSFVASNGHLHDDLLELLNT